MTANGRSPLNINHDEFEFSVHHSRLIFSCWTEGGSRTWRVNRWNWNDEKLLLHASRRTGAETSEIELVPHASAKAIVANIAAARHERCEQLARVASEFVPHSKVEMVKLSPGMRRNQPGRYARIILRLPHERIAVTGIVAQSDLRNVDALFSSALLWFQRVLESPKRPLIQRLLLVVEHEILEATRQRHVLLRDSFRDRIELLEIDDTWNEIRPVARFERTHLWRKRLSRFPPVNQPQTSDRANEILGYALHAIDVVASRNGQTLRFHGLPFARVRTVMNQDRIWFGIEGSRRRQLDSFHQPEWAKLFRDLETYRSENGNDGRHWLYRASGEAWLESILRRDITKLDPGLIVAPLHAQFRTSHGGPTGARPIDLLALRHDGRLVVIELKVTADREHVFQGVDYWRRVEAHRRRGHIAAAKLFGEREMSDESPLVYLVAPTLRFHPSFPTLARTIASDIEIYRFDINEDWRSGVRVVRRERVNA